MRNLPFSSLAVALWIVSGGSNNAECDGKLNLLMSVKVGDALRLNNRVLNLSRYEAFERPV